MEQNGCDAANSLSDYDEISMIMIKIVGNGLFVCTNVLVFKIQMNLILHLWFVQTKRIFMQVDQLRKIYDIFMTSEKEHPAESFMSFPVSSSFHKKKAMSQRLSRGRRSQCRTSAVSDRRWAAERMANVPRDPMTPPPGRDRKVRWA